MKVQNPIIGRARGSAGGMTFCKNYDKNVARAKAFEVSNPNTQAQQTQRNFFKELSSLVADFSEDQLRTLFPNKPKTMSRRNALAKQIAQSCTIDGTEKTIDYADIDTLGNATVMDFGTTDGDVVDDKMFVYLDQTLSQNPSLKDYDFIVALVNADKQEISLTTENAKVSVGELYVQLPGGWTNDDEIYFIPFITNSKESAISTSGFGTISVIKRPARKND